MTDEESGNTATVNLVGPRRASPSSPSAASDRAGARGAEAERFDVAIDDADLVPAVQDYGVAPSRSRLIPERTLLQAPPAPRPLASCPAPAAQPRPEYVPQPAELHDEPSGVVPRGSTTSIIGRSYDIEVRSKAFRAPRQTSWRSGAPWIVGSALFGGLVAFVAVRVSLPPAFDASASDPSIGAAAPPGPSPAPLAPAPPATAAIGSPAIDPADPARAANGTPPASTPAGDPEPSPGAPPAATQPAARSASASSAPRIELFARADEARSQGKLREARSVYRGILSADPDDFDALTGMGDLAHAQGKYSDARAFYEHALLVNPSLTPALLGLADTLWDLDDQDGARAQYRELLKRAPPSSYPPRVAMRAAL